VKTKYKIETLFLLEMIKNKKDLKLKMDLFSIFNFIFIIFVLSATS